jgi:hypothetical protein
MVLFIYFVLNRKHGIFHLTDPGGIGVIHDCPERGFHPHKAPLDGSPIYEHCSHVYMNADTKFNMIDLRERWEIWTSFYDSLKAILPAVEQIVCLYSYTVLKTNCGFWCKWLYIAIACIEISAVENHWYLWGKLRICVICPFSYLSSSRGIHFWNKVSGDGHTFETRCQEMATLILCWD